MSLTLAAPIERWDEAIPLGNGLLGGLLWGQGNEIRLSMDRGGLWDLRRHPSYTRPGFNYATVVSLVTSGQADKLNKEHAIVSDYPTKLPGARLVVKLEERFQARSFSLDMKRALGLVDVGTDRVECLFPASEKVALLLVPGAAQSIDLVANEAVKKLGYAAARLRRSGGEVWLVQDAAEGFQYVVHAASRRTERGTLVAIAVTTNREAADPQALARERTAQALQRGYQMAQAEHERWWSVFWARSSVRVPDEKIQQHYNLVEYLYGAGSKRGAPPLALQGLWTADEGTLPPWRGDYHHNLNTQLTYWAYLAAGHFDEGRSFLDFMWDMKPRHERFAREFHGLDAGMVMPGVTALDGNPMGSWFPVTLSPTMGAWISQAFYWHWRYEMDGRFLAERAYPYSAAVGEGLVRLLKPDPKTGKLKLPLSTSPEIHDNSQRAWLTPNSNCDLALMGWLFSANAEMASALGKSAEATRWLTLQAQLDPLAVSESGTLLLAPGEALLKSHRHPSHLMAIHPLGLVNVENGDGDRRIIDASLAEIDRLGTSQWCGYSFSWMATMRARAGRGDEALRYLTDYVQSFILRNGFHVNGEQTRKGLSELHYRPFTLEGNFAAAQAVHEMLLQSWGGRVRVFPATPSSWREASFENLRAEGGFAVSADRRDGRVRRVLVRASVDQELRLKDPFAGRAFRASLPVQKQEGELRAVLRAGQSLELTEEAAAQTWTILPLGDSITACSPDYSCYRTILAQRLAASGLQVRFVGSMHNSSDPESMRHEGHGSKNAEFLAENMERWYTANPADVTLLHAGHNHFGEEKPVPGIVAATESIIATARRINPRVIILLAQVIPAGKLPKYAYIPELNREIGRLAARLNTSQQPVILVDQAGGFNIQTDTIADLVHPNAAGAEKIAARWCEALAGTLSGR